MHRSTMEGYLDKKSGGKVGRSKPKLLEKWTRRYFVLPQGVCPANSPTVLPNADCWTGVAAGGTVLSYYKDESAFSKQAAPLGRVDCRGSSFFLKTAKPAVGKQYVDTDFRFTLVAATRALKLKADTAADYQGWLAHIERAGAVVSADSTRFTDFESSKLPEDTEGGGANDSGRSDNDSGDGDSAGGGGGGAALAGEAPPSHGGDQQSTADIPAPNLPPPPPVELIPADDAAPANPTEHQSTAPVLAASTAVVTPEVAKEAAPEVAVGAAAQEAVEVAPEVEVAQEVEVAPEVEVTPAASPAAAPAAAPTTQTTVTPEPNAAVAEAQPAAPPASEMSLSAAERGRLAAARKADVERNAAAAAAAAEASAAAEVAAAALADGSESCWKRAAAAAAAEAQVWHDAFPPFLLDFPSLSSSPPLPSPISPNRLQIRITC